MWHFFGDDNHFPAGGSWLSGKVFLMAGYAIQQNQMHQLLLGIEQVKARYGMDLRHPVKFNMKDNGVTAYFAARGEQQLHATVRQASVQLRIDLLQLLRANGAKTFACLMGSLGFKKPKDYYRWATTNLLQRVPWLCRTTAGVPELIVCLDWPSADVGKEYSEWYHEPWHDGHDAMGNPFLCGSLRSRSAFPDVVVSSTIHNPFLQLADVVTGAFSRFVTRTLGNASHQQDAENFFTPVAECLYVPAGYHHYRTSFVTAPTQLAGTMQGGYAAFRTLMMQARQGLILPR